MFLPIITQYIDLLQFSRLDLQPGAAGKNIANLKEIRET